MLHSVEVAIEIEVGSWRILASCEGEDIRIFFPSRGESTRPAKMHCWGGTFKGRILDPCPVRSDCLEYALSTNQLHGIWGGMSTKERRSEKRSRRARS